jgi:hypothetical protein
MVEYRAVHAHHHPSASALTWDGRCTWWDHAPWSTTEREIPRSVVGRQDDCDHVAWWLDAAEDVRTLEAAEGNGQARRTRPAGRAGITGRPARAGRRLFLAVWRAEAGSWYRSGGGPGPGARIVARPRTGMNQQFPAAVDPIVSGSLDPPGDGAIDR